MFSPVIPRSKLVAPKSFHSLAQFHSIKDLVDFVLWLPTATTLSLVAQE